MAIYESGWLTLTFLSNILEQFKILRLLKSCQGIARVAAPRDTALPSYGHDVRLIEKGLHY